MNSPALPPRPDAPPPFGTPAPTRSRSRAPLIGAVALLLVGAVAFLAFLAQRSGDAFPDVVLGFERLHGGAAGRAEAAMEDVRIGEIEIRVAVYGEGDEPRLLAAIYDNYPERVEVEAIIEGAASGAEASGGEVDQRSLQVSESDGYRFACMSGGGPGFLVPGGPSEDGVLCVFVGDTVGLIVTTHTTEPVVGLVDARSFVEAYGSA